MSPLKRNITRVVIFTSIVLFTAAISSGIYYLKIKKNEDIQNQLQFRELRVAADALDMSLAKLQQISQHFKNTLSCEFVDSNAGNNSGMQATSDTLKTSETVEAPEAVKSLLEALHVNSQWLKKCQAQLQARINQINQSQDLQSIRILDAINLIATSSTTTFEFSTNSNLYAHTYSPFKSDTLNAQDYVNFRLAVDANDLISSRVNRFSLVVLVNEKGELLGRKDYIHKDASTVDLRLTSLQQHFPEDAALIGTSIMRDVTIAGIEYRMYMHPLVGKNIGESQGKIYIAGLTPLSTINVNKLLISPVIIMWAVLALLLLIAFIPLLKLKFINSKYAFTNADVSQIVIGLVMFAGILSIAANQQMFYQYFMDTKVEQGKLIHKSISADFSNEISALEKHALSILASEKEQLSSSPHQYGKVVSDNANLPIFTNYVNPNLAFFDKDNTNTYIIEQLARLNEDAGFVKNANVHYIKQDLFINSKISLAGRAYFKRAMACETWQFAHHYESQKIDTKQTCEQSLFIQRINNIEDGRKTSMLAKPLFINAKDKNKQLLIFNTRLQTFMHRVLPLGFGFAVINETGDVLYHSDDEASLVENIFVETSQNKQLITAVNYHSQALSPIDLVLNYAGKEHIFITAPLVNKNLQNALPWHLVVFFDKQDLVMNNMLLVFLAVLILLAIIVPLFLLMRFIAHQKFWNDALYFKEKKVKRYPVWTLFFASLSVACLLSIGLIDDLLIRLIIWLGSCLGGILFLYKAHKTDLRPYYLMHYPQVSIIGAIAFFALLSVSTNMMDLPVTSSNKISALLGILFIVLAYLIVIKRRLVNKLNHYLGKSVSVPKAANNSNECKVRPRQYADDERFTAGFVAYLVSLVFLAGAVPAILVVNSTHGYLLQRQAQLQTIALNESVNNNIARQLQYLNYVEVNDNKIANARSRWNCDDWTKIFDSKLIATPEQTQHSPWINIKDDKACEQKDKAIIAPIHSAQNLTDDLLDRIFATLSIQDALGTKLTYLALNDMASSARKDNVTLYKSASFSLAFRPDLYMRAASLNAVVTLIIGMLLLIAFLYIVLKRLVVKRLLGEHVPDHFRVVRPCDAYSIESHRWPLLRKMSRPSDVDGKKAESSQLQSGMRILLLNANTNSAYRLFNALSIPIYNDKILHINDMIDLNAGIFTFEDSLRHQFTQQNSLIITIAVSGLDELSGQTEKRKLAVQALANLSNMRQLNIIVVADTGPGYRLLKQEAYEQDFVDNNKRRIDIDEKLSWSKLLTLFDKEYLWTPKQKHKLRSPLDIGKIIDYESKGWDELSLVKNKFFDYHLRIKSPRGSITDIQDYWLPEQVVEFFLVQARALYRKHWELCTVDEKVALWQLANGAKINPANAEVLQHLTRRGFIYRDQGWRLVNESFKRFVLSAESDNVVANWMDTTRSGLWPIIRIPLFTILFVLVVVIVYSSGFALNSVLGIATTTLGIIPLLLKNLSLLKTSGSIGD